MNADGADILFTLTDFATLLLTIELCISLVLMMTVFFSAQYLWSMFNALQLITLVAMIDLHLPVNLQFFLSSIFRVVHFRYFSNQINLVI